MSQHKLIDKKAQAFFEKLWRRGDPWNLETSEFEQAGYARQLALLHGRSYARALEIGCGAGCFTRLLAQIADHVVGIDISSAAIARARAVRTGPGFVDYRVANIMDTDMRAEGTWDLIVMSETIYYLGWLYPFFDVAWLAVDLLSATREGGRFLMANTCGGVEGYLLEPWLIRTYRDVFLNVGYRLEAEDIFRGSKDGVPLEVLISLFVKTAQEASIQ